MKQNEDTLVQEGLTRNEAKVVVYLARQKEGDIKSLAKTIQASIQQCQMILDHMVNRGILTKEKTEHGPQFSLSSFLNELLIKENRHGRDALRLPPFKLSKASQLVKQAPT